MSETLDNVQGQGQNGKRPSFLTVLCILTWVGSGFSFLTGVWGLLFTGAVSSVSSGDASIDAAASTLQTIQIINLICVLMCIFGAVMMWKLKKTGFFIYLVGELVPLIASLILLGGLASVGGAFGGAMAAAGVLTAIFPVAFVVMYAVNLKHMK